MSQFYRGAKLRESRVLEIAKQAFQPGGELTLGECIYVIMDLRHKKYRDLTKQDLLRLVEKAWDAYAEVAKLTPVETEGKQP